MVGGCLVAAAAAASYSRWSPKDKVSASGHFRCDKGKTKASSQGDTSESESDQSRKKVNLMNHVGLSGYSFHESTHHLVATGAVVLLELRD